MDSLKVIKNELVPVYVTDSGAKIVDGRELHAVLQSKQDFSTWVKRRLNECDAVENKDYKLNHNFVEQVSGTKHRIDYTILLDTAKEMAMLERNAKGKQVRRYFIKVDEKYKEEKSSPLTLQQQVQTIAKGTAELYERVDKVTAEIGSVKADLEQFKEDMPILGVEEGRITKAVKKRGVEILGGKEANAYKDRSLRGKLYSDMHRELRRQFDVTTYKAIKRNQCDTALDMIKAYVPPMALRQQIENINSQMSMEV